MSQILPNFQAIYSDYNQQSVVVNAHSQQVKRQYYGTGYGLQANVDEVLFSARNQQKEPALFFPELEVNRVNLQLKKAVKSIQDRLTSATGDIKKITANNLDLIQPTDVLVVLAHPDDELMMLGTLKEMTNRGLYVQMAYLTSGCQGKDISNQGLAGAALANMREEEQLAALKELGVTRPPVFLNVKDGEVRVNNQTLVNSLEKIIARSQPKIMVTFGPDGLTQHDDHIAVNEQVLAASRRLPADEQIPVYQIAHSQSADKAFLSTVGRPQAWEGLTTVEDSTLAVKVNTPESIQLNKVNAMNCHKTQFAPELVESFRQFFAMYPYETFTRAE